MRESIFDQPFPPFGASYSKARTLATCARHYGFQTYESWQGWHPDAPGRKRSAYLLKQLTSMPTLLGTAVHEEAERFARTALRHEPLPTYEEITARLEKRIKEASQARDFEAFAVSPTTYPMLRSTYYDGQPNTWEIYSARQKVPAVARNLVLSNLWEQVGDMSLKEVRIEEKGSFALDGVMVHSKIDLFTRDFHDRVVIVDYKCGGNGADHDCETQLGLYALHAQRGLGIDFQEHRWHGIVINWATGQTTEVALSRQVLQRAEEWIRQGIKQMRFYQSSRELNIPVPLAAFPEVEPEQAKICSRQCPFLELCAQRFALRPNA